MGLLGLIGGVVGAFGSGQEPKFRAEALEFQAETIEKRTELELLLQGRRGKKAIGATTADFGAAGVLARGSAGDVLRESARDIALEKSTITEFGAREAELKRKQAKAAKAGGQASFAADIFGAVSEIF